MSTAAERTVYEKKGHDAMEAHATPEGAQLKAFTKAEGTERINNQHLIEDVHKELMQLQSQKNVAASNSELKGITSALVQNHVLPEMKIQCGHGKQHNAFEVVGTTPNHQGFVLRVTDKSGHNVGEALVVGTDGKLYHGERKAGTTNQIEQGKPLTAQEEKALELQAGKYSKAAKVEVPITEPHKTEARKAEVSGPDNESKDFWNRPVA